MEPPPRPSPARPRRTRLLFLGIAALAALVLVAALVVPLLVDVSRHRDRVEAALAELTGWDVEVGELSLSVLRGLAVTASPVRLRAPSGVSTIDIPTVAVRARLWPLLRGRLEVRGVSFDGPDIVLGRRTLDEGWVLPAVLPAAGAAAGEAGEPSGLRVSIERVAVDGGRLTLDDRSGEAPWVLALEDVDVALGPETGAISGDAAIADGGGGLAWEGNVGGEVRLTVEDLATGILQPFLGDLLQPGGRLSGTLDLSLPREVRGRLTGEELRLLAGERPLEAPVIALHAVSPEPGKWEARQLDLETAGATVRGTGRLLPDLDVRLEVPPTPIEQALQLARSLFPLEVAVEPPGTASASIRARMPEGGELTYEATGEVTAARFLPGEPLPPVEGLQTRFVLDPTGMLALDIGSGTVAGGPLRGTARLDQVARPGRLTFDGTIDQASFGRLLSGFVPGDSERLEGPTAVAARLSLDLARPEVDVRALGGALELNAHDVLAPAWDLEEAVIAELRERLGPLAELEALVRRARGETAGTAAVERTMREVLERIEARIDFDRIPWSVERFGVSTDALDAAGQGTFDPLDGAVDLRLAASLGPVATGKLVERYSALRHLVKDGRLVLPLTISGALTAPRIGVDLGTLRPEAEDVVRDELRERAEELLRREIEERGGDAGDVDPRSELEDRARERLDRLRRKLSRESDEKEEEKKEEPPATPPRT